MAGYGQFFAYENHNPNTSIDTITKKVINIQFGIGSISFINSIIINTLINSNKFYSV